MMAGRAQPSRYLPPVATGSPPGLPERLVPQVCHPSGIVVCAASGPSLTIEDLALVRGRATVVAINDAIRFAPWADVFFSNARIFWTPTTEQGQQLAGFAGLRVRVAIDQDKPGVLPDGTVILRNTGTYGFETVPNGLRTYQNSGGSAINLAVHLGARRVVLLGYDMGPGAGGRHHCHETYATRHSSPYNLFTHLIQTMTGPLAQLGVEVVNCSRATKLTCFPRKPLEEVFSDGRPN